LGDGTDTNSLGITGFLGGSLSPRIDHRPPIIAFVFLVVLAIAVIGTSARAVDGSAFLAGPLGAQAHTTGKAGAAVEGRVSAVREVQLSRSQPRVRATAERSERAVAPRPQAKALVELPGKAQRVGKILGVSPRYDGKATASKHGQKLGLKLRWRKVVSPHGRGR